MGLSLPKFPHSRGSYCPYFKRKTKHACKIPASTPERLGRNHLHPRSSLFESDVKQLGSLGPNGQRVGMVVRCSGGYEGKLICVSALYPRDVPQPRVCSPWPEVWVVWYNCEREGEHELQRDQAWIYQSLACMHVCCSATAYPHSRNHQMEARSG